MRIHVINAFEGDCLLLENDVPTRHFALIDGGPSGTFDRHLQPHLRDTVGPSGTIDVVMVTHVDADHIAGVLDLLADIERARVDQNGPSPTVAEVWHNSFGATIDDENGSLQSQLHAMMSHAGRAQLAVANGAIALLGINQGARLRRLAVKLHIPINGTFAGALISQDQQAGVHWSFGNARFEVIGPTAANLVELRKAWLQWVEKHLEAFASGDAAAMANADKSVPNLSSIVVLGATTDGDILLTGDARGDHILQGLEQSGAITAGGTRHFRLLKVQHHGSDRNVTHQFFDRLTADIYVISANGKYGNPDKAVLTMLVDSAHAAGRTPMIVLTNETPSVQQLLHDRPMAQYGYHLTVRNSNSNAVVIDLNTGSAISSVV